MFIIFLQFHLSSNDGRISPWESDNFVVSGVDTYEKHISK